MFTNEDISKITDAYHAWRGEGGEYKDVKGFCKSAKLEEIQKQDFILTPGRYVGTEEVEDDGEPFEEKMTRLTKELGEQFKEGRNLEEEIKKNLTSIKNYQKV
jgi:type I restriction enzyme M protein